MNRFEHGFCFEQWVVTPADNVVSGPFGETRLEPRVMDVLVHLAAHGGEVVSRSELIDSVWGGAIVGDEVLSRCIYLVRQALGENGRDARFVQTVPKRGYRLNARVIDLDQLESPGRTRTWQHGSPYRGLQVFDVEHAAMFFGRTRSTFEALAALEQQANMGKAFVLLIGASGVGKSSLARAGLLSGLIRSHDAGQWYYDVFFPASSPGGPVQALADSLERALGVPASESRTICDNLIADPASGGEPVETAIARHTGDNSRIVLVVDQLEEVFSSEYASHQQCSDFFVALERLSCCGLFRIIATLRSDFYPHCVAYPALMRLKKGVGQYDVRPLRPSEIQQTIRLPAMAAGLEFQRDGETGQRLDHALYEEAVAQPRLLPLLQFTLQALYDARLENNTLPFSEYRKLGGIEGSLAKRADETFNGLPPSQRDALPLVMSRLVTMRDGHVSTMSCAVSKIPTKDARQFVEAFVHARLFSSELSSDGEPQVSLTHETLLTHWPRLRDWIDTNRQLIRARDRVASALVRWESESRPDDLLLPRGKSLDEARQLKQAPEIELGADESAYIAASDRRAFRRYFLERASVAGLVVLAVAAAGFAWLADIQRDAAIEQQAIAEKETLAASETADFLLDVFSSADPNEATGGQLTAKRILDDANARLDDGLVAQAELRTRLRALIARAYKGIGLYSDAEAQLRDAETAASGIAGFPERDLLGIQYQLADVLFQQGNLEAAEALHAKVLARRQVLFGDNDLDTLESLLRQAHKLWRDGDMGGAERLFRKVLRTRQEQLGEQHRLVTDVLSTLGSFYYTQSNVEEAERYYRAAAAQAEATYGPRNIGTAIALSNLALVETDPAEREALLNRSLAIRTDVFGAEHPLVARAEEILANFYATLGQPGRAEPLYRQAIRKLENSTEQTPILPWIRSQYGVFLEAEGRYEEAINSYRTSRDEFAGQVGISHRWTLNAHRKLGMAVYLSGDVTNAQRILRDALDNARLADTPSLLAIAELEAALANPMLEAGDVAGAIANTRAAIDFFEADAEIYRASLITALGTYAEAQLAGDDTDGTLATATRAIELGGGDINSENALFAYLAAAALALDGDCPAARAMIAGASSVLAPEEQNGPHWQRIRSRISATQEKCAL
jgi:DNA-binding winged helix-turn-helix (wHTH) protein/Tfp pilus assembly protein PilF